MSLGTDRVRYTFNPSGSSQVDDLKRRAAELINMVEMLKQTKPSDLEFGRLCSLAQDAFEDGAMWAVKAATAGKS